MDASSLILIGMAVVALAITAGAFTIAYRRSVVTDQPEPRETPGATGRTEFRPPVPEPREPEPSIPTAPRTNVASPEADETDTAAGSDTESPAVELLEMQRVVEVPPEEAGVTRRQFLNRAAGGMFGTYMAALGISSLAFLWPRLSGGFGARVDAGSVEDISTQLLQGGRVAPLVVNEARAYIVPINEDQREASQFNQPGLTAGGLMAMYWRCVHLGCRAPWCDPSEGFECPCHGSKYNLFGEYQAGPAPRNLDRFSVEVTENGHLIIDTGIIVQTPRAPRDSVPYPQGPSCISL